MFRNTRFGEVLKGLPRGFFETQVEKHQGDKHSKGFRCWDQLVAMVYGQVSASRSLRELEAGFNSQCVHHYHLGTRQVKRSTLAEANTKRSSELYADVCSLLLSQAHRKVKKELKELLYLVDSTSLTLKGRGYDDWTLANKSDRVQGLKVHMVFASQASLPVMSDISAANVNDIEWGRDIKIEKGATYVFDKGYYSYNWWYHIHQQGAFFVTRLKHNAAVKTVKSHSVEPSEQETILEESEICFKNKLPGGKRINHYYGASLRKIVVARPDTGKPLELVTNDFIRSAEELALLYKQRWQIELFFKWIKQNLKIKQFLGRSENAVRTQIYTALITYLLIMFYHERHAVQDSLKLCLAMLKSGLFQRPEVDREIAMRRRNQRAEHQQMQGVLAL